MSSSLYGYCLSTRQLDRRHALRISFSSQLVQNFHCCHLHCTAKQHGVWVGHCSQHHHSWPGQPHPLCAYFLHISVYCYLNCLPGLPLADVALQCPGTCQSHFWKHSLCFAAPEALVLIFSSERSRSQTITVPNAHVKNGCSGLWGTNVHWLQCWTTFCKGCFLLLCSYCCSAQTHWAPGWCGHWTEQLANRPSTFIQLLKGRECVLWDK